MSLHLSVTAGIYRLHDTVGLLISLRKFIVFLLFVPHSDYFFAQSKQQWHGDCSSITRSIYSLGNVPNGIYLHIMTPVRI